MFEPGRWATPSCSVNNPRTSTKKKKQGGTPTQLTDEELRQRIFANAAVLFPSSNNHIHANSYEIVYGSRPRIPSQKQSDLDESPPWQYALLVRRNPSGDYTPLIKGQAWSTAIPWSMALQGLLDTTATAIHKKLGTTQLPPLGFVEQLPRYSTSVTNGVR